MVNSYCGPVIEEGAAPTEQIIVEGPDGQVLAMAGVIITPLDVPPIVASGGEDAPQDIASAATDAAEAGSARERDHLADALVSQQRRARCPASVAEGVDARPEDEAAAPTPSSGAAQLGGEDMQTVAVPYIVSATDTFATVCMRHRMTASEVLQLNGLRYRRCRPGDVLMVWGERSEAQRTEEVHRQLVRQFQQLTGASMGEATFYLEQHAYVLNDALREHARDLAFEREHAIVVDVIRSDQEAAQAARAEAEAHARAQSEASARQREAAESPIAKCLLAGTVCVPPPHHPAPIPASG